MRERYLRSVRLLAECMHAFERFTGAYVRGLGLTQAQFDIVATLGNTPGMSYKELGERTLITKGTLTGVIERLERKGLVAREQDAGDKRLFCVRLTPEGEELFRDVFPKVIANGKQLFAGYGPDDFDRLDEALLALRQRITDATTSPQEDQS